MSVVSSSDVSRLKSPCRTCPALASTLSREYWVVRRTGTAQFLVVKPADASRRLSQGFAKTSRRRPSLWCSLLMLDVYAANRQMSRGPRGIRASFKANRLRRADAVSGVGQPHADAHKSIAAKVCPPIRPTGKSGRHRIGYEGQGCSRAIDVVLHRPSGTAAFWSVANSPEAGFRAVSIGPG